MATDPHKLKPGQLCHLLNSTPLGEVISQWQLRNHRTRAGLRIGDGRYVDLLRYVAWLMQLRHKPKSPPSETTETISIGEAAQGAAELGSQKILSGHGQKFTSKQEALIAALLTEPSYAAAAAQVGISPATVYRWLNLPDFRAAYRQARRELVEAAIGRLQTASGLAVEALVAVTRQGRRDSDRVRAAVALLDRAVRGLTDADTLHGDRAIDAEGPLGTSDVVTMLAVRLQQLDQSELPTSEKMRLTATLADALLRAISIDVLDKRLEAVRAVLMHRKDEQQESKQEKKR